MISNTIHRISYLVQIHAWNLSNVQVDCKEIIKDAEILKLPLRNNPGIAEDQTVCDKCLDFDARNMKRIYVRERQPTDESQRAISL